MNRYTQLSASEYKPQDLQTMMIAPMMMRQRHDQALAQQEQLRSQMASSVGVLDKFDNQWKNTQNEFNTQLDVEAENLARYGYNKNSSKNMSKLNSMYGKSMTLKNEMDNAKAVYQKNYDQYIEAGLKDKHDLATLQSNWMNHASDYTGYDKNGKVSTIGAYGAAKNVNVNDALDRIKKFNVNTVRTISKNGGPSVGVSGDGSLRITNHSGSVTETQNVQSVLNFVNMELARYDDPTSEEFKSAVFKGLNPAQIKQQIVQGALGMMHRDVVDTRNSTLSVHGYKNPNADKATTGDLDMITSSISETNNGVLKDVKSISDLEASQKKLLERRASGSLTPDEARQLENTTQALDGLKKDLENNPEYNKAKKQETDQYVKKLLTNYGYKSVEEASKNIVTKLPKGAKVVSRTAYEDLMEDGNNEAWSGFKSIFSKGADKNYIKTKDGSYKPINKSVAVALKGGGVDTKYLSKDLQKLEKEGISNYNLKTTDSYESMTSNTSKGNTIIDNSKKSFLRNISNIDNVESGGDAKLTKLTIGGVEKINEDHADRDKLYSGLISDLQKNGIVNIGVAKKLKNGKKGYKVSYSFGESDTKLIQKYGKSGSFVYEVSGNMTKNNNTSGLTAFGAYDNALSEASVYRSTMGFEEIPNDILKGVTENNPSAVRAMANYQPKLYLGANSKGSNKNEMQVANELSAIAGVTPAGYLNSNNATKNTEINAYALESIAEKLHTQFPSNARVHNIYQRINNPSVKISPAEITKLLQNLSTDNTLKNNSEFQNIMSNETITLK